MDPKVYGKLLTTHWKGYGVDVEALHGGIPLRQNAGDGSKMGSRGYRRLRWRKYFLVAPWMFLGYVGLYRRKKYVGGRPRGPRDRGRPTGERGPLSCGVLGSFLTCTPSSPDLVRSKNHAPEGFIPFGLRLIFLFFEILK